MGPNHSHTKAGAPGTVPTLPTQGAAQAHTVLQQDLEQVLAGWREGEQCPIGS